MSSKIISILTIFYFVGCTNTSHKIEENRADYLSIWFNENADSLMTEFHTLVQKNNFCSTCDTNFREAYYQESYSNSILGRFTSEAKKYCDSLSVTYIYSNMEKPNYRILLSTNYSRTYTRALDSILKAPVTMPNLRIYKYEPPDLRYDGFYFPNSALNISNSELRFIVEGDNTLKELTVLIYSKNDKAKLISEDEQLLTRQLFGEELILKKLGDIHYIIVDSVRPDLPNLNNLRKTLAIE
jgi:hypothetical protein